MLKIITDLPNITLKSDQLEYEQNAQGLIIGNPYAY
jgi:hypothetical protein